MKTIEVPSGEHGGVYVWALIEQDKRISTHWSRRGLFVRQADAKAAGDKRMREISVPGLSVAAWCNYSAGFGETDVIRWWMGEHEYQRLLPGPDVLAAEWVTFTQSGTDWNHSAYTQLIEKEWITES